MSGLAVEHVIIPGCKLKAVCLLLLPNSSSDLACPRVGSLCLKSGLNRVARPDIKYLDVLVGLVNNIVLLLSLPDGDFFGQTTTGIGHVARPSILSKGQDNPVDRVEVNAVELGHLRLGNAVDQVQPEDVYPLLVGNALALAQDCCLI